MEKMRVLLVDDDIMSREAVAEFLEEQLDLDVTQTDNGIDAIKIYAKNPFPLVMTDIKMPKMDGITLLSKIRERADSSVTDIIIFTGFADLDTAIQALRMGAHDYLRKPLDVEELANIIQGIIEKKKKSDSDTVSITTIDEQQEENQYPRVKIHQELMRSIPKIGTVGFFSDAMKVVLDLVKRFAADRDIPVLLEGETGCGKEIIANLLHWGEDADANAEGEEKPFIPINCSAIPPHLFESELFGYESGTFTGANTTGKKGKFELAQGGTLFLDEIAEMPIDLQPKLLRALQEKEIYKVGGERPIKLDVRLIAATNRNIKEMIEEKSFREDLYHRINMGIIRIPPLREQKEAIIPLSQLFLEKYAELKKKRFRFIGTEARKILLEHNWTGNIRELRNCIERVVLLHDDIQIRASHLAFLLNDESESIVDPHGSLEPGKVVLPEESLDIESLELEIVRKAYRRFKGNKTRVAEYLGISRSALRSRLNKIDI